MPADVPLAKAFADLAAALKKSSQRSHSGYVLMAAEILRADLIEAINIKTNPLTSAEVKRLLGSYSSPATLYTRIEIAHKMGILSPECYRILTKVLAIRNIFGHPEQLLGLDEEPVLILFRELHTNANFKGSYIQVFIKYIVFVHDELKAFLIDNQITGSVIPPDIEVSIIS